MLDDDSTDGTADVVRAAAAGDPRLRVITGIRRPPGVLGKPHACAQLAARGAGEVLVYVDADVVLAPHAVAAAVALMRGPPPVDLFCPWPRQVAEGPAGRLVQPLLAWSWWTRCRCGRRALPRPSMAAANGQFLLVDAGALRRAGGWQAVAGEVLDDIGLARAVRAVRGPHRHRRRLDAGHLPDVRDGPRAARRATASRCGRRSAPAGGARRSRRR